MTKQNILACIAQIERKANKSVDDLAAIAAFTDILLSGFYMDAQ